MHRMLPAFSHPAGVLSRSARRVTGAVAATAVAGVLLTGAGAGTAQALTVPSGSPVGDFGRATAVTGGLQIGGWAADPDTTAAVTLEVTVAGVTHQITTGTPRADVPTVYPQFGPNTGFATVLPLPTGSHQVCVTAVNVGPGTDTAFPCRTATVTSGTAAPAPAPTTTTATTTATSTTTATAPVPATTSTTAPVPAPVPAPTTTTTTTARKLSWAPPALTNPITIAVSATNRQIRLAAGQDYVIKMPSTPLDVKGGLIIAGGRNVVLIGGEIRISKPGTTSSELRGMYLKNQTGTIHVEGLKITGSTLAEGINLDQRAGGIVQLQNVRVDTVRGSKAGLHADIIQSWGGPRILRVDGLTGYTTYQGLFLLPNQYGGPAPELFDLRNVNLVGQTGSKYLFWRDKGTWPARTQNVWASTSQIGAPRGQFLMGAWNGVLEGKPATGDIVPAGLAGLRYVSPGYTR